MRCTRDRGRYLPKPNKGAMGLFDSLFGNDPSTNWPEHVTKILSLNLADLSLNSLTIGTSAHELSAFGRPSNKRPFKEKRFTYHKLGIEIEIENDLVSYFAFPLARQPNDFTGPCALTLVLPNGSRSSVDSNADVKDLLENLPAPMETHREKDETIYFISIEGNTLELETSTDGLIRRINVLQGTEL